MLSSVSRTHTLMKSACSFAPHETCKLLAPTEPPRRTSQDVVSSFFVSVSGNSSFTG